MESHDDDARLMLRYREGDLGAFEALYSRHKAPRVLRAAAHAALRRFRRVYPNYDAGSAD
jgi:hypothetical protein